MSDKTVRKHVLQSTAINAALSIAFFLAVFGVPGRALAWAAPDRLALDFLPQAGMIGLMSALVPSLIVRRELGAVHACRSTRRIVAAAGGWALVALLVGAGAAGLAHVYGVPTIGGWQALLMKTLFGAALGAGVTSRAIRRVVIQEGTSQ